MPSSAGRRLSSGALRSWSQKKRASHRRARSTRSLPATIAAPPSCASMLATTTKRRRQRAVGGRAAPGISGASASRSTSTSGGSVHELRVDPPEQRHRPLDQARDLVQQARVVGEHQPLRRRASAARAVDDQRLALVAVEDRPWRRAACRRSRRSRATVNGARRHEAVALASCAAALDAVRRGTARPRRRTGTEIDCSGRTQRRSPRPQRIDFGHGKPRERSRAALGQDVGGRPAAAAG